MDQVQSQLPEPAVVPIFCPKCGLRVDLTVERPSMFPECPSGCRVSGNGSEPQRMAAFSDKGKQPR